AVLRGDDAPIETAQVAVPVALVVVRPAAGCGEQIAAGHPPGIDDIEPVHRGGGIEHEQLLHLPRGERLLGRPAGEELRAETRVRKLCGRAKEERAESVEVVLRGRNEL